MEVITSSLLRKFSENLHEQNRTILTNPPEKSPCKLIDSFILDKIFKFTNGEFIEITDKLDTKMIKSYADQGSQWVFSAFAKCS